VERFIFATQLGLALLLDDKCRHCPVTTIAPKTNFSLVAVAIFIKVKVFPAAASEALVMVTPAYRAD